MYRWWEPQRIHPQGALAQCAGHVRDLGWWTAFSPFLQGADLQQEKLEFGTAWF